MKRRKFPKMAQSMSVKRDQYSRFEKEERKVKLAEAKLGKMHREELQIEEEVKHPEVLRSTMEAEFEQRLQALNKLSSISSSLSFASSVVGGRPNVVRRLAPATARTIFPIKVKSEEELFDERLENIKRKIQSGSIRSLPTVLIHYAPEMKERENVDRIYKDLLRSGLPPRNIFYNQPIDDSESAFIGRSSLSDRIEQVKAADWIILIGSPELKKQYDERKITEENIGVISSEIDMIRIRDVLEGKKKILLVHRAWQSSTFPSSLQHLESRSFSKDYFSSFLSLLKDMGIAEE